MVHIETAVTKSQKKEFMSFGERLYRDNVYAVPDLFSEEMDYFNSSVNPAYAYCETRMFLARDDSGAVVGRVAAILNKKFNAKVGENRMRISRFDTINDPAVSSALLGAVEAYARGSSTPRWN